MEDTILDEERAEEVERVRRHRRREARRAGLTKVEADLFADSDIDIGELRRLKEKVPPEWLAQILL